MTDKVRANIAKHEARYAAAWRAAEFHKYPCSVEPAMTYSEAMEEMRKAGSRLYNLRRQLARATA